jgi:hypothetical protein
VRITVRSAERAVVRDGHGTGEGRGAHLGEAHDLALKAAETDATKRALVTFGKAFGLALYSDRGRRPAGLDGRAKPDSQAASTSAVRIDVEEPMKPAGLANGSRPGLEGGVTSGRFCVAGKLDTGEPETGTLAVDDDPNHPAMPKGTTDPATSSSRKNHRTASHSAASFPRLNASALRGRIEKSTLLLSEPRRVREKEHLRYVAAQPCLLCSVTPSDAHHVRLAQPRAMGRKVGDEFTVPLCRAHHRELHHDGNEAAWWHGMGIDPIEIARQFWNETEGRRTIPMAGDPV